MPLGKEVGLGPGHIVLDGDPVGTKPPTATHPHFRPMPIVAKRSPISATAELLYSNNAKNLHHLTTHSTTVLPHKMAIALRPQICYVISPYVLHRTAIIKGASTLCSEKNIPLIVFSFITSSQINQFAQNFQRL